MILLTHTAGNKQSVRYGVPTSLVLRRVFVTDCQALLLIEHTVKVIVSIKLQ